MGMYGRVAYSWGGEQKVHEGSSGSREMYGGI